MFFRHSSIFLAGSADFASCSPVSRAKYSVQDGNAKPVPASTVRGGSRQMNGKDHAFVPAERCKNIKNWFHHPIFSIEQTHAARGLFAVQNFRTRLHKIAERHTAHIARRHARPADYCESASLSRSRRRYKRTAPPCWNFRLRVFRPRTKPEYARLRHSFETSPGTSTSLPRTLELDWLSSLGIGWCRGAELNCLRRPFQGRALPVSYPGTGRNQHFRQNDAARKGKCAKTEKLS